MRYLRVVLYSVYLILLLLLLVTRCNNKDTAAPVSNSTQDVDTLVHPEIPDDELIDKANEIGGNGKLKVTLLWDYPADLDLHVRQPNGVTLCYRNKSDTSTGGALDVDNTRGGQGAAENMFWENPISGTYEISVHYFEVRSGAPRGGYCSIVVIHGDSRKVYKLNMKNKNQKELVTKLVIP